MNETKHEVKTGDFVLPGDFLGTSEEFLVGDGVYEEGGRIYSALPGVLLVDMRERKVSVFPKTNTIPIPKNGDIVIGQVVEVKEHVVLVEVVRLKGREDRELPVLALGGIHISQAKDAYISDFSREFRPGDIIRSQVTGIKGGALQLSTTGKEFGVIKAKCSKCKVPLVSKENHLECPNCRQIETRKLAIDYRSGKP